MTKNIFRTVIISVFMLLESNAFAGKVELTTYYPAPQGEYNELQSNTLQSNISCVGEDCGPTDLATLNHLTVRGNSTVSADMTVQGVTRVGGDGTSGFVIRRGEPATKEEGQIWIQ